MPTTSNKALPYPPVTDPPNGPLQLQQLAEAVDSALSVAVELGAANLNTYTVPGIYAQTDSAEAATASNYPVSQPGLLEVFKNGAGSMVWQRYTVHPGATTLPLATYVRGYSSGTWTAWKTVYNETDWATLSPIAVATGGGSFIKWKLQSNMVIINVAVAFTTAVNSGVSTTLIATANSLPAAYRPVSGSAFGSCYASGYNGQLWIGPPGDITFLHQSGAARLGVNGQIIYPVGI